jgi:hypothetical protein
MRSVREEPEPQSAPSVLFAPHNERYVQVPAAARDTWARGKERLTPR